MKLKGYEPPKITYILHITDSFTMEQIGKIPNKWNQFWMKALLGFKVTPIKEDK